MDITIEPIKQRINAHFDIDASDKSISHRVCMFALFADSVCRISHFLYAEDTLRSLTIAQSLGMKYEIKEVHGKKQLFLFPPKKLQTPNDILYCGNSGTSMRLFTGLLAGANIYCVLSGDKYLHVRPMGRVLEPLRQIGVTIFARIAEDSKKKEVAPISIIPTNKKIQGFTYHSNISSAQVKSAMILAGLQADSPSSYTECALSRDHSENMLHAFQKYDYISIQNDVIHITPFNVFNTTNAPFVGFDIDIPNDPSSAFFFAVLACIIPNSCITLERVMINKTRIEAFRILERMGANIIYENVQKGYESTADITIRHSHLKAVDINENIAWLIDEIPALSIACALAEGTSRIRNAEELRVKESDRISVVLEGLKNFGIETYEYPDGFDVIGGNLHYGEVDSRGDHRIAMSFAIAACVCGGKIQDCECIQTSFPNFLAILEKFTQIGK
ncbi:3-phosphoshikimate 1-carboxyvinyltransferase [Helicobacter didelphidarum]|uniref:3-phosphoshikimate 1-carboxyvinyltransferase n=1 Tax=Helicobacter didelphidarum TaxID=2040648 RepID=A0A3D8IEA9_9HELI|nr:3-phosphoshikimate 1-carboxyvinyltransferase [Helicobacter didelphidarum]RDU63563.1 3-phosphoshikimate 1-carboxyvinyltransferase [Helicobacter didelphidarum]